ncbi:MAG TPA: hypothetical protein VF627_05240 [Abditibacterium sp.]|jgi:hypothetical protein
MVKPLFPLMPPMTDEEVVRAKRENRPRHGGKRRRNIIEIAVLFTMIVGGFAGYYYFTRLPFNSTQWKSSGTYEKTHIRSRMCDDLLKSNKLINLNHSQVVVLLGKPDQYSFRGWDMGYLVGNYMIDPVMLVIKFDQRKRVVECDVRTFG